MQPTTMVLRTALLLGLAGLLPGNGLAQTCPRGAAVALTVADAGTPNRGGNTPLDQFTTHQDHKFTKAHAFTFDDLGALATQDVPMILPYDGVHHVFSGPTLAAVLQAAGGASGGVTVAGIDGYHIDYSAADIAALHPVLAYCEDGKPLGIGDLGPAFIVYTPKTQQKPTDEEFARMVWGVYWLTPLPGG